MLRVILLILVAGTVNFCGREEPHAEPSFIGIEHEDGDKNIHINMCIDHVHDATWHIPYSSRVERDFEPAIETALQVWLQPLREMGLRNIVTDFKFYRYNDGQYPNSVPWDDVLFRIVFSTSSGATKGLYRSTSITPEQVELFEMRPEWLPILTLFNVGDSKEDFKTDSFFMYVLVHEMGHCFGLSDTYSGAAGQRKGNQPVSVMGSDYAEFNYPPVLPAGKGIELTTDDIKGLIWLYKKHIDKSVESLSDCYHHDYKYDNSPPGCVPGTPTQPTEPPPQPPTTEPTTTKPPPQPPTTEPTAPNESCAANPCSDNCLTGCAYHECGYGYANPNDRYRSSCRSRDNGQWCGSAGQDRDDVCREQVLPPPTQPDTPSEPPTPSTAQACCESGFGCAAWPGKADIYLCSAGRDDGVVSDTQSPCCRTADYECETWPGKTAAVICFGL